MLEWESVGKQKREPGLCSNVYRAQVPGGWLVWACQLGTGGGGPGGLTFVPDPRHAWK